jgi:hypothetical protein
VRFYLSVEGSARRNKVTGVCSGDSCKRVAKILANDSSTFENDYFGGKIKCISLRGNGGGVGREENHDRLFGPLRGAWYAG